MKHLDAMIIILKTLYMNNLLTFVIRVIRKKTRFNFTHFQFQISFFFHNLSK